MSRKWTAKWLQDPRFYGLQPIDTLYRHKDLRDSLARIAAAHRPNLSNVHMLLRKSFPLDAPPIAARIVITADDCYKLWINGRFVGEGPANQHPWNQFYNVWEIAPFLRAGENVLAVRVYYQGIVSRVLNSMDHRMGMIAEADIALSGGGRLQVISDGSWKYAIVGDETNVGAEDIKRERSPEHYYEPAFSGGMSRYFTDFQENIDARRMEEGWRETGFDDSRWKTPSAINPAAKDYNFVPQPTPPLQYGAMKPRAVRCVEEGRYVVDFGEEVVGSLRLRQPGGNGHVIEIRHGEELNPDGTVRWRMRCSTDYREFWTLSARPENEYEPFGYKGFRYAEVIGAVAPLTGENCHVETRNYPWPERAAEFECNLPDLNRIWEICARGVRLCAQEAFLDCPQREKGQYLGDVTIAGHAHALLSGDSRLFRKALNDFAQSARICPTLPSIAPGNLRMEIADYSLQYPMQLEQYYRQTGDAHAVRLLMPVAETLLEEFRGRYADGGGLLRGVADMVNLVDHPPEMADGYDAPVGTCATPAPDGCVNLINAFYLGALQSRNRLRRIVGRAPDDIAPLAEEFRRRFWDASAGLFTDAEGSRHSSLHANALPLLFGLVPAEGRASVKAFLRRKRMACGVYFSYFLLSALCENGERELAFDLLTCDDSRSWRSMLKAGATACLEAWTPDMKTNCSFCHAWAASPIPILVERIAGLTPAEPGWATARFDPCMPRPLERLSLRLPTPRGEIHVSMSRDGEGPLYNVVASEDVELLFASHIRSVDGGAAGSRSFRELLPAP